MNYIVVGTDCAGKTSLVNMLSNVLEMQVVKGSSFELSQCSQDELFEKFAEFTTLDNVIFDRFTICNCVYAPMYKDFAMLTSEQRRLIENLMMYNAKVIYLYADDEVLAERFNKRGDEYVNLERLLEAKKRYEEEIENIKYLEVVKYDTGKMKTYHIVEDILLNH